MHSEDDGSGGSVSIAAEIASRISFATHQCDVPVIAELTVRNTSDRDFESLTLSLSTAPEVVSPRTWQIDRLNAGSEARIKDRRVSLAGGMLANLTERMRAELTLELRQGETVLATATSSLTALARNEWGGGAFTPELLAAFVMPNDPAVQRLLKETSKILDQAGKKSSIDGYQSKSRERSWELVSAIWTAVAAKRITYAQPPTSFETEGQKIRFPSDIERHGLATCLDTALLFASAIEQAGLYPVVAFTRGHAFCGAWLQPQHLSTLTTDDSMDLRKAVGLKELVLFETTLATGSNAALFSKAVQEATRQIGEEREADFTFAIDIKQARSRQITPLATAVLPDSGAPSPGSAGENEGSGQGLEPAPDLPSFDFGMEPDSVPTTAEGRVDQWKRKLLDLTKRNRLLNLRPSITAIPIVCPDPSRLEDKLAAGEKITIIPLLRRPAKEGVPDAELFTLRTGDELATRFAADALERNEIVANVSDSREQDGQTTFWPKGMQPRLLVTFRGMKVGPIERSWSDVPHIEKLGLAREILTVGANKDSITRMAERIGLGRVVTRTREQLAALLTEASKQPSDPAT